MNTKKKIDEIDFILLSFEDWMHGEDGENCTKARKLLDDVKKQLLNERDILIDFINYLHENVFIENYADHEDVDNYLKQKNSHGK